MAALSAGLTAGWKAHTKVGAKEEKRAGSMAVLLVAKKVAMLAASWADLLAVRLVLMKDRKWDPTCTQSLQNVARMSGLQCKECMTIALIWAGHYLVHHFLYKRGMECKRSIQRCRKNSQQSSRHRPLERKKRICQLCMLYKTSLQIRQACW